MTINEIHLSTSNMLVVRETSDAKNIVHTLMFIIYKDLPQCMEWKPWEYYQNGKIVLRRSLKRGGKHRPDIVDIIILTKAFF